MKKLIILLASMAVAVALALCYSHLFRSVEVDNSALGLLTFEYRWGRPHLLLADSNRDGKADFRASFQGQADFGDSGSGEYWEDRNFDGIFELHVFQVDRKVIRLEVDEDGDGVYERVTTGEEASISYQSIVGIETLPKTTIERTP